MGKLRWETCFKTGCRVGVSDLHGTWQTSLTAGHWAAPGAHQDDGRLLEYRLQVHEDTGDTRELLQEPHPHSNQDGLVDEGILDLSTGNPLALGRGQSQKADTLAQLQHTESGSGAARSRLGFSIFLSYAGGESSPHLLPHAVLNLLVLLGIVCVLASQPAQGAQGLVLLPLGEQEAGRVGHEAEQEDHGEHGHLPCHGQPAPVQEQPCRSRVGWEENHRITEVGKKPLRSSSPAPAPTTATKHVPKCHIATALECLQGWTLHRFPVPVRINPAFPLHTQILAQHVEDEGAQHCHDLRTRAQHASHPRVGDLRDVDLERDSTCLADLQHTARINRTSLQASCRHTAQLGNPKLLEHVSLESPYGGAVPGSGTGKPCSTHPCPDVGGVLRPQ